MNGWSQITERLWERLDGARVENPLPTPGYPKSGCVWFASEPGDPLNRIRCAYDSAEKAMFDADKLWPSHSIHRV